MSLTNRLSLYFLAALVVVLSGFSISLYVLVRSHLYAQLDENLHASMKALLAAVEVHPRDVQWEPMERRITTGESASADQPRWTLHDLTGALRDRSANLNSATDHRDIDRYGWRVLVRQLRSGNFEAEAVNGNEHIASAKTLANTNIDNASTIPLVADRTFASEGLIFIVAVSKAPVVGMLRWLAFTLAFVSTITLAVAGLLGYWLCRRALRPIRLMAASARSIEHVANPELLLDVPSTRDELEDLGRAFNELLADLRESLERQRRFAGDASHQLRTPLTAMLASVEVALRHERSPEEYRRALGVVMRRGGQLRRIIESLLFLARTDGSALIGSSEAVEINEWCDSWLEAWADHPRRGDIQFQPSTERATVTTHPALLGQVMDNLLDNACKYSDQATPIGIIIECAPGFTCIHVKDLGCGIADEQQPLIFEPFFRTDEARWRGSHGVGLGLAVVQRLVTIMGAKIEVVSKPGKGSDFRIHLPPGKECSLSQGPTDAQFTREAKIG